MEYSGAGGKLIHEKNQKQKILWHCPFNIVHRQRMSYNFPFKKKRAITYAKVQIQFQFPVLDLTIFEGIMSPHG